MTATMVIGVRDVSDFSCHTATTPPDDETPRFQGVIDSGDVHIAFIVHAWMTDWFISELRELADDMEKEVTNYGTGDNRPERLREEVLEPPQGG